MPPLSNVSGRQIVLLPRNISTPEMPKESNLESQRPSTYIGPNGDSVKADKQDGRYRENDVRVDKDLSHEATDRSYGLPGNAKHWEKCHELLKHHDKAMSDAWREEVDKLLIFAGLFSAIVTAFIIESYKWLQPDSGDTATIYLGFLAVHVAQIQNITLPEPLLRLDKTPGATSTDVRINILWFMSLVLSLSAVLIGILCLQWLREFQRETPSVSHKDAVALRQMKFRGLMSWNVSGILSTLPVLLQLALLLFFTGILELLWERNHTVAAVITVAVGMIALFLVITTSLPAFQHAWRAEASFSAFVQDIPQCPFKSAQSWLFLRFLSWIHTMVLKIKFSITHTCDCIKLNLAHLHDFDWTTYDEKWTLCSSTPRHTDLESYCPIKDAIIWMSETWSRNLDIIQLLNNCLPDLDVECATRLVTSKECPLAKVEEDLSLVHGTHKEQTIISIHFLYRHIWEHPELELQWVESVLQTYSPRLGVYRSPWLGKLLQSHLHVTIEHERSLIIRILKSFSVQCCDSANDELLSYDDIWEAWLKLSHLTRSSISARSPRTLKELNADHFKLACKTSKAIHLWLQSHMNDYTAMTCLAGLQKLLPIDLKPEALLQFTQTFPEVVHIAELVKFLGTSSANGLWKPPTVCPTAKKEFHDQLSDLMQLFAQFGALRGSDDEGQVALNIEEVPNV